MNANAVSSDQNGAVVMPTLVRLLTTLALIAGLVFSAMLALVHLVEPTPREVVIDLPLDQLQPPPPPGQPIGPPRS